MISELPTDLQLDALREVANIGCGNAATALSRLVGGRAVRIDVPRVHAAAADAAQLAGGMDAVACASLAMTGDVVGKMLLMWPEDDARELARLMLDAPVAAPPDEEPQRSALSEAANIVASACLSSVATMTRLRLLPTPPELTFGDAPALVAEALRDGRSGEAAVILEARFYAAHTKTLVGQMLLVPDRASLPHLFRALGL